jgi:Ni/Co efflux regulator RcnB
VDAHKIIINVFADAMDGIFTPEQLQQVQEMQLAAMGEMPFVSPSMFEALGLTDSQRQEMERIKKELEPEFEKNLDDFVANYISTMQKIASEHVRGITTTVTEDSDGRVVMKAVEEESVEEILKRLMAEDPEFRRVSEELQTRIRDFSTQFRIRMFDVLDDAQWQRLQDLIDNPPEHAVLFRRHLRESMGLGVSEEGSSEDGNNAEESDIWVPGPNSWRPGDPIPEQYRQERNKRGRFPRTEP